ncbi:MAG: hypothetical protein KGJ57_04940 [Sphingomonadales bacterium]|nr:hypothetical protein [Sphingomonadales bacterium]MDE2168762.1 hypothetical protein [Sphingomonadales bacterium]
MTDELSDIPRHFIEDFKKAGADYTAWQVRAQALSGVRLTYALRWLAQQESLRKSARLRHEQWMYRLAVTTAILALIAAVEGAVGLLLPLR